MEKITGNEIIKNMEYLVKLLHNEWERSGRTKEAVSINAADLEKVRMRLAKKIQKKQGQLKGDGVSFKQCMDISKENYILLRLAKKIKRAEETAKCQENDTAFIVEMDKEEYGLFSMLTVAEKE